MPVFEAEIEIERNIQQVWDLLVDPAHLLQIAPPDAGLELVQAPAILAVGSRVEMTVRFLGMSVRLVHEITDVRQPLLLVENLVEGPIPSWRHEHILEGVDDGRTRLRDRVEYKPPSGLSGLLMTAGRIEKELDRGFAYRQQSLKDLLEAS